MKKMLYPGLLAMISSCVITNSSDKPDPNSYPNPFYQLYTNGELEAQTRARNNFKISQETNGNAPIAQWKAIKDSWPRTAGDQAQFHAEMEALSSLYYRIQNPGEGNDPKVLTKMLSDSLPAECRKALGWTS